MTTTEIIRKNLFPNARCVESGAQPYQVLDGQIEWRWNSRSGFLLTSSKDIGAFAGFDVEGLEPGSEYVLAVEAGWLATTDKARWAIVSVHNASESNPTIVEDVNGRPPAKQRLLRFTAPQDGHVHVCFRGPSEVDEKIGFYDIQLELASTYDAAVSGGGSGSSPGTPCRNCNGIRRAGGAR